MRVQRRGKAAGEARRAVEGVGSAGVGVDCESREGGGLRWDLMDRIVWRNPKHWKR